VSAVALHPSEITFVCPPWCRITREEHLEDLGNHQGRCFHTSADREGQGLAPDETWAVALSSITYPDGTQADDAGVTVEIDAPSVYLTPDKARALVQALIAATAEAERGSASLSALVTS
jgi:hypothetical protein